MLYEQYKAAIERSNIVSRTDIHGIITFVNDEFCRISGYSRDELIGRDHNIVRHPDVPAETFRKLWDTILQKKSYHSTVKNLAKDGSTFYVNTTITPILDANGEIEEFIAIRYDVTKEIELQMQLQEKQEMLLWQSRFASLGQMMANIAHHPDRAQSGPLQSQTGCLRRGHRHHHHSPRRNQDDHPLHVPDDR